MKDQHKPLTQEDMDTLSSKEDREPYITPKLERHARVEQLTGEFIMMS
jgi:hypothetical protein